jgi:glycosyltransferase involved in cell wall biosynthesis
MVKRSNLRITTVLLSKKFYGGEKLLHVRLKGLATYKNIPIQVITEKDLIIRFQDIPGVRLVPLPNRPKNLLLGLIYLVAIQPIIILKTVQFKSSHLITTLFLDLIAILLTSYTTRTKIAFQYPGHTEHLKYLGFSTSKNQFRLGLTPMYRHIIERLDCIIIGEEGVYDLFQENISSVEKGKTKLLLLALPIEKIHKPDFEAKIAKSVVFLHRLDEEGGSRLMLKIIPKVLALDSEVFFYILGDGPLLHEFRELSNQYPENMEVPGFVNNPTAYLKKTQVSIELFCVPNQSNFTVLESFNTGNLVMIRELDSLKGWFQTKGKNAEVIFLKGKASDMANQILLVFKDQEKLTQIAKNGNNILTKRHNLNRLTSQLYNFLSSQ